LKPVTTAGEVWRCEVRIERGPIVIDFVEHDGVWITFVDRHIKGTAAGLVLDRAARVIKR
jgi:hypothetical protein